MENKTNGQQRLKEYVVAITKLLRQCKDAEILEIILQLLSRSREQTQ